MEVESDSDSSSDSVEGQTAASRAQLKAATGTGVDDVPLSIELATHQHAGSALRRSGGGTTGKSGLSRAVTAPPASPARAVGKDCSQ